MTYLDSFAKYMEDLGVATRGQNLFIGEVPRQNTDDIDEGQWWIVASGGSPVGTDFNLWRRELFVNVFYRDRDANCVFQKFEDLRTKIYDAGCPELDNYRAVGIDVSTELVDSDVDTEENRIGVMVIRLTVMSKN